VAKNIVLAGVGHVGIADDTPCYQAAFGNFLVSADADPSSTVGQSSAQTLAAMNPLITVSAQPLAFGPRCGGTRGSGSGDAGTDGSGGGGSSSLTQASVEQLKHLVAGYDVVVSTRGVSSQEADGLEQAAAAGAKQLYLAEGPSARVIDYPPLSKALGRSVAQCGGRRPVHPLYQVVRAVRAFEAQEGRPVRAGDETALKATAAALEASEGAATGSISTSLLESWVLDAGLALAAAPAAAVAGGVLANSIIRSISR
ncbi:ThiF domain-containing protein, partial [Haematococcus lacustris]